MRQFYLYLLTLLLANHLQAQFSSSDSLAAHWQILGKYDKAIIFANQAIELHKGKEPDSLYLSALIRLGSIFSDMYETQKAENIYLDVLKRVEHQYGKKHPYHYRTLDYLTTLYVRSQRFAEAEEVALKNQKISGEAFGNQSLECAIAWMRLGEIYYYTGTYDKAIDCFLNSKNILGKSPKKYADDYAVVIGSLGVCYMDIGKYELAEQCIRTSLQLALENQGKKHQYINNLHNLAFVCIDLGKIEEAEAYFLEAITLGKEDDLLSEDHDLYASFLSSLATLYMNSQRYEQAEPLYKQALDIYKQQQGDVQETATVSSCINNLAVLYKRTNKNDLAEPLYRKAAQINQRILGSEHNDYAVNITNLAWVLLDNQKLQEAEQLLLQAKHIFQRNLGNRHPTFAGALQALAIFYTHTKRWQDAQQLLTESKIIIKENFGDRHPQLAKNLHLEALLHQAQNQYTSALELCQQAIVAQSLDMPANENLDKLNQYHYFRDSELLDFLNTLLLLYQQQSNKDNNLIIKQYQIAQAALSYGEQTRHQRQEAGDKLQVLRKNRDLAAKGIQAALALQQPEYWRQAFVLAEQNKAISLADATKAQRARVLGDLPDSLAIKEWELEQALNQIKKQEITAKAAEKSDLAAQRNQTNFELEALKKQLKDQYPQYFQLKYANITASAADIQKQLGEGVLFLEYFIADSAVYLFALSKDHLELLPLKVEMPVLKQKISELRRALSDYNFIKNEEKNAFDLYSQTAHWFYKNILAPALQTHINQLVIVCDGELGHLPFEVFLTQEIKELQPYSQLPYLIKDYSISYNYSATLWQHNRQQNPRQGNGKMLAIAADYKGQTDSTALRSNRAPHLLNMRNNLEALPAAQEEVRSLSAAFEGNFWWGNEANERHFKTEASQYSLLHLAMHGLLNQRAPLLSSLAFSENGDSTEDNFLEAWEIAKMSLNADLVVLSACETGYGRFEQGEGVMSIARSFMYAGVPSVVVSLWEVNDASTSIIMQDFYRFLSEGKSKDQALQLAKLQYLQQAKGMGAHPAFWSPFVQIGDERAIKVASKGGGSWFWWMIAGGSLCVVLLFAVRYYK